MSHRQTNPSADSHPRSQRPNAPAPQDSGVYGPNTFRAAGAHVGLQPGEVDALGRVSPSTQWQTQNPTMIPQIPANRAAHHTSTHPSGHSQQYPPQMHHQVAYGQGTHTGLYQHPAPHFHPPPLQPQPHNVPHAPQQGGSHPPQASAEHIFAWNQLCRDRVYWNRDTLEPYRRDGQSVLMNFTLRAGGTIECRVPTSNGFCDYSNSKKGRLLHHIRKDHLDFLPFACGGGCSSQNCELRFACEASRDDHTHPRKAACPFWKEFCSQNVAKHRESCRQRPSISG